MTAEGYVMHSRRISTIVVAPAAEDSHRRFHLIARSLPSTLEILHRTLVFLGRFQGRKRP